MHVEGAVADWATQNVIEPLPVPENPERPAVIDDAGTAVPVVAAAGAAIVSTGEASDTTVLTAGGHPVFEAPLLPSPGQLAYHQ